MNFVKQITVFYLVIFLIGCGAKPPISVPEARELESRIVYGEAREILKASMNVLQDMYYTIEEVDSDMGILIATKLSEGKQAEIRKEETLEEHTPVWKKILVGVFVVAIIGGFIYLITGGSNDKDESDQNSSHHHHNSPIFSNHNNGNGKTIYRYRITINASDYSVNETKLRITTQGEKIRNDEIISAGPIHDAQFYTNFYNRLEQEIGF